MTQQKRGRITQTSYFKDYKNFEDGMAEICRLSPKIKHIIYPELKPGKSINNPNATAAYAASDVYRRLAGVVKENTPDPVSRENILWEYYISADRVSVKTNQFIGFGWQFKSIPTKEGYTVSFMITIFGISQAEEKLILDAGFVSSEEREKKKQLKEKQRNEQQTKKSKKANKQNSGKTEAANKNSVSSNEAEPKEQESPSVSGTGNGGSAEGGSAESGTEENGGNDGSPQ